MTTIRTIGPLHFEDLARQLAYEFKPWQRLEATGRSGSDDGFDARGYEIVAKEAQPSASAEEGESIEERSILNEGIDDRLWLIQCKRERRRWSSTWTTPCSARMRSSTDLCSRQPAISPKRPATTSPKSAARWSSKSGTSGAVSCRLSYDKSEWQLSRPPTGWNRPNPAGRTVKG